VLNLTIQRAGDDLPISSPQLDAVFRKPSRRVAERGELDAGALTVQRTGESSPLVNVVWGFANIAVGFALLRAFAPQEPDAVPGWIAVGAGVLTAGVAMSRHFGRVRGNSG
jgi:hypothetical protein